jgi:hypothetical protein
MEAVMCWSCSYGGEMKNPYRILAEKLLGKEPLERQSWEISIRTDLRGIICADKK